MSIISAQDLLGEFANVKSGRSEDDVVDQMFKEMRSKFGEGEVVDIRDITWGERGVYFIPDEGRSNNKCFGRSDVLAAWSYDSDGVPEAFILDAIPFRYQQKWVGPVGKRDKPYFVKFIMCWAETV